MKTEIKDKKGNITAYGFACGYVESMETGEYKKEMYKEHNTYHVKRFHNNKWDLWLSFEGNELVKARNEYKRIPI